MAEKALGAPVGEFLKIWEWPKRFTQQAFLRRRVDETVENNKEISGGDLMKEMSAWSYCFLGIGIIVGTGIFSFVPYIYATITGPAVVISLIIAAVSAALSSVVYSEFAVSYPVVGGGFAYTLLTFGELMAMLCGVNLCIDYIFGGAATARNFSVYLSQLLNKNTDIFLVPVSFQEDPIDYMALILAVLLTVLCCISTKIFDESNWVTQVLHLGLIVFTIVAAFVMAEPSNWTPFFPEQFGGPRSVLAGAAQIFFVFVGFDVIALGAEEAKTDMSLPVGTLFCVIIVTVIYVLMAAALVMLIPFNVLADQPSDYAYLSGFAYAFQYRGLTWAKYIVAAGALVGIVSSTAISIYGLARVITVFARERMIPPFMGAINTKTQTPILATVISGLITGLLAFFSSFADLANMTSIGTLVMYWFVSLSYLYRRYCPIPMDPMESADRQYDPQFVPFRPNWLPESKGFRNVYLLVLLTLITGCPVGFSIYWSLVPDDWLWLVLTVAIWAGLTLLLQLSLPIEFVPEKFKVNFWLVPWIGSLSIFSNVMIIGGFAGRVEDYSRVGIACGIAAAIYVVYGMTASSYRFKDSRIDKEVAEQLVMAKEGSIPKY